MAAGTVKEIYMPDYAAIQAAIEPTKYRRADNDRAPNAAYVPSAAVVASPAKFTPGIASRAANDYVPPNKAPAQRSAPRTPRTPRAAGGARVAGKTDTPSKTETASSVTTTPAQAPISPAQVAGKDMYVPPIRSTDTNQPLRRPTPCELGLGGCGDPTTVSSHVAQWERNAPISARSALALNPLIAQLAQGGTQAAQASAQALYQASLASPTFQSDVDAQVASGVPYQVAVANARRANTDSTYAQNLLGTPNVIRAVDASASQDMAANAVANTPYLYQTNNNAGYVPAVTQIDPATGSYTVNSNQFTNTGLRGADVPIAVGQSIAQGMAGYIPTALQNIATVGKAAETAAATNAKMEHDLARQGLENQGALTRQALANQGALGVAQERARARQSELPVAPVVRVK